jgi:hypothetical protein
MKKLVIMVLVVSSLFCRAAISPPTSKSDAVGRAATRYNFDLSGGQRVELPASSTGTGRHDFYSLFARLPIIKDAVYGIGIAADRKLSFRDARVTAEGIGTLKVDVRQQLPAGFGNKVDYVEATFTREVLERASTTGMTVHITNSKGSWQFTAPSWMFAALIEAADQEDIHRQFHAADVRRKQVEEQRRKSYTEEHPELSERIRRAILEGKLVLGMSAEEARAAWGAPSRVNKTVNAYTVSEQWVYGDDDYVYFENGKINSWQSSR